MLIIADDISGAAECAGVGWRRGLDVDLCTDSSTGVLAGFSVIDTDSRLLPDAEAAARVQAVMDGSGPKPGDVFKKTDSVLRGPVRAELEVLVRVLGCRRCLLVPTNPPQGRTVERGRLLVRGVPLDQTEFARDPHHPARSADVRELLGQEIALPVVSLALGDPWPERGICIGDARTDEDLRAWAARTFDSGIPVAGSAPFLSAVLAQRGCEERRPDVAPVEGAHGLRTLICSGSASPASRDRIRQAEEAGMPVCRLLESGDRVPDPAAHFATTILCIGVPVSEDPGAPERLLEALAGLVAQCLSTHRVDRLLLEGGATAACVLRRLGMKRFRVIREWAPGVVTLRAVNGQSLEITIKPGSYPWLGPFAEAIAESEKA
jgi:D-threonate/D-erythronate kinase